MLADRVFLYLCDRVRSDVKMYFIHAYSLIEATHIVSTYYYTRVYSDAAGPIELSVTFIFNFNRLGN